MGKKSKQAKNRRSPSVFETTGTNVFAGENGGKKFHISNVTNSTLFKALITNNGGRVVEAEDDADYIIVTTMEAQDEYMGHNGTPVCQSDLLYNSVQAGEFLDANDYLISPRVNESTTEKQPLKELSELAPDSADENYEPDDFMINSMLSQTSRNISEIRSSVANSNNANLDTSQNPENSSSVDVRMEQIISDNSNEGLPKTVTNSSFSESQHSQDKKSNEGPENTQGSEHDSAVDYVVSVLSSPPRKVDRPLLHKASSTGPQLNRVRSPLASRNRRFRYLNRRSITFLEAFSKFEQLTDDDIIQIFIESQESKSPSIENPPQTSEGNCNETRNNKNGAAHSETQKIQTQALDIDLPDIDAILSTQINDNEVDQAQSSANKIELEYDSDSSLDCPDVDTLLRNNNPQPVVSAGDKPVQSALPELANTPSISQPHILDAASSQKGDKMSSDAMESPNTVTIKHAVNALGLGNDKPIKVKRPGVEVDQTSSRVLGKRRRLETNDEEYDRSPLAVILNKAQQTDVDVFPQRITGNGAGSQDQANPKEAGKAQVSPELEWSNAKRIRMSETESPHAEREASEGFEESVSVTSSVQHSAETEVENAQLENDQEVAGNASDEKTRQSSIRVAVINEAENASAEDKNTNGRPAQTKTMSERSKSEKKTAHIHKNEASQNNMSTETCTPQMTPVRLARQRQLTMTERLSLLRLPDGSIDTTTARSLDNTSLADNTAGSSPLSPMQSASIGGVVRALGVSRAAVSDADRMVFLRRVKGLIMDTQWSAREALEVLYACSGNWQWARSVIASDGAVKPWMASEDVVLIEGISTQEMDKVRRERGCIEVYRRTQFLNTYHGA